MRSASSSFQALRVGFAVAAAAGAVLAAQAQQPSDLKLERLSDDATAAQVQRAFYDAFVANGVPPSIASLLTVETTIVERDDDHIQFVQTMIGGGRRQVEVTVRDGSSVAKARAPFLLEDGTVGLAERVSVTGDDSSYRTTATVYVPPESVTPELTAARADGLRWLELVGISAASAQPPGSGVLATYTDSFASSGSNPPSMQTMIEDAGNLASSAGNDLPKLAQEIGVALEPATLGPKTLWQHRADVARRGAKALDHAGKVYKILSEHDAREARLRALLDCAENPTLPTAKDAQRTDPNYQRATSDVIEAARAELKMNTAIRMVAATINSGASVLLGSGRGRAVSALAKIEDKLLNHVADKYIMEDAGKGVAPCERDCGPVYVPEAPPAQLASYPPDELTCSNPAPEQLTCEAGSGPNSTPGPSWVPSPPNPPPPAPTCVTLTSAEFAFHYERESSGCVFGNCSAETEARGITAIVPLRFEDGAYLGDGTAVYRESFSREETARACSQSSAGTTEGSPEVSVDILASIDNDVVGGIDTSAMPADTSVVEIFVEGDAFHIAKSTGNCYTPSEQSNPTSVSFDCHFYGVELFRPGSYRAFKSGEPSSGVCTLTLR